MQEAAANITDNENQNMVQYTVDQVPDKDMYYQLINMFPNCDFNQIRKLLIVPPFNPSDYDRNTLFALYTDQCLNFDIAPQNLNYADNLLINNQGNIEGYTQTLQIIFPNADPTYLSEFVMGNLEFPETIHQFIEDNLVDPKYPTKDAFLKKKKFAKFEQKFINNFDVENFLELYKDPVGYFENVNRKCLFNEKALNFLLSNFNFIQANEIKKVYETNSHNLTLTVNALEKFDSNSPTKKLKFILNDYTNKQILHEIAFNINKDKIKKYLDDVKTAELEEYKNCEKLGSLLICATCFVKVIPSRVIHCEEAHIFCKECLVDYIKAKMSDGVYTSDCMLDCNSVFRLKDFQKVLDKASFKLFLKKKQEDEVIIANLEGLITCPFCNILCDIQENEKVLKCFNPKCLKESCKKCKLENHLPLHCKKDIEQEKARLLVEETMTKALIRTCYKCNRSMYKEDGCNKIFCPNCKSIMCYLCHKPINDDYKHFRPQGSHRFDLCPLWSNAEKCDAKYVRKIALDAKKEVERANPEIQIEINKILPEIPVATQTFVDKTVLYADDEFSEYVRIRDNVKHDLTME